MVDERDVDEAAHLVGTAERDGEQVRPVAAGATHRLGEVLGHGGQGPPQLCGEVLVLAGDAGHGGLQQRQQLERHAVGVEPTCRQGACS